MRERERKKNKIASSTGGDVRLINCRPLEKARDPRRHVEPPTSRCRLSDDAFLPVAGKLSWTAPQGDRLLKLPQGLSVPWLYINIK